MLTPLIICTICAVCGFFVGRATLTTISDTYTPKSGRTPQEQKRDAVLRLQNELVKSGAVKRKSMPDGKVKVSLRVMR